MDLAPQSPSMPMSCDPHRVLSPEHDRWARAVADTVAGCAKAAVAFSGGVDSSVVLALTVRAKGPAAVVAVLGVSPSLADSERAQAHAVADELDVTLVEVHTQEMEDPRYVVNDSQRCYFCKHELYTRAFSDACVGEGADILINGDTADDAVSSDRAGRRAALELGVGSPLVQAGMGKAVVRTLARELGLPVWDKPSSPCLASRVPRSVPVTIERLRAVELAEAGLRSMQLRQLRVRHRGDVGVVELGPDELAQVQDDETLRAVERIVTGAGFQRMELAPGPLRRD